MKGRAEDRRAPVPPAFDGYRGLVIVCIVLLHVTRWAEWQPQNEFLRALRLDGYFSIDFLFVVSGFLLFLPVVAKGVFGSVRKYAVRRIGRIVPAYVVSLAATWILVLVIGHPPLSLSELEAFAAHLVFAQHELNVSGFGVNEVYWFLSIIALFYVLLPFVANRYLRHPLIGLAIAVAIVAVWRSLTGDARYLLFIQFPLFVADFAVGMTVAWLFIRVWRSVPREQLTRLAVPAMLVSAIALFAMLYPVGRMRLNQEIWYFGEPTVYAIAIPIAFALMMATTAFAPSWMQWPFANRGVRWLGSVSYGVFLYHIIVLQIVVRVFDFQADHRTSTVLALLAIVVPVSLLLGWLSLTFVEEPTNRWARRLLAGESRLGRRRHAPAPAPEQAT
jgi:peptidoglycan/LPS O-acetylase OafA/YrhL